MKKIAVTLLIFGWGTTWGECQTLSKATTLTLTDRQILRLDSAINYAAGTMDSKQGTNWFLQSFAPIFEPVKKQMALDTAKKKK